MLSIISSCWITHQQPNQLGGGPQRVQRQRNDTTPLKKKRKKRDLDAHPAQNEARLQQAHRRKHDRVPRFVILCCA